MTELKHLIEPELLSQLDNINEGSVDKNHHIKLTYNRFDLAFKLYYLQSLTTESSPYRDDCYKQHIKAFSEGTFCEPNNNEKTSYEAFKDVFKNVFLNIKEYGFDSSKSLIPLAADGSILNGAHRAASTIFCQQGAGVLQTALPSRDFGFQFFKERGVPNSMLDIAARTFTEYDENSFLAIVWPAAKGHEDAIDNILSKVVYKKRVKLNYNGAHNLLAEAYKSEPWLGPIEQNYPGIKNKLVGCFPDFDEVRLFLFQADNLDDVLALKDEIRDVFKIEKHAIHITDTQEETIRLGRLLFNENGIHFLNNAYPRKILNAKYSNISDTLSAKSLDSSRVLIGDKAVMELYGFHPCQNLEYLSVSKDDGSYSDNDASFYNEFYPETSLELFDNPKHHFWFKNIKYIALEQVYQMKLLRGNSDDLNDIKLIKSLLKNTKLKEQLDIIRCNLYFKKITLVLKTKIFVGGILRKLGLFDLIRKLLK